LAETGACEHHHNFETNPPPQVAACGRKAPLFAAFAVLKTRALYVILSLIKNICSILTRTHHERSFDHVGRNKRTQAEADIG